MAGNGLVVPGESAVDFICASGDLGKLLLKEIAHPKSQPKSHSRVFGTWHNDTCAGWVFVPGKEKAYLSLKIGNSNPFGRRTLFIENSQGSGLSLKAIGGGNGVLTLRVDAELCLRRLPSFANQLVNTFIVHGHGWKDRNGKEYTEPYGTPPTDNGDRHRVRPRRNPRHQRFHYWH